MDSDQYNDLLSRSGQSQVASIDPDESSSLQQWLHANITDRSVWDWYIRETTPQLVVIRN